MSKIIPLTRGRVTLVDDADFEWLNQWKWRWQPDPPRVGYAARSIRRNGKHTSVMMHRLILEAPSGMVTDHRNRNGLDNRKANLRLCTRSQNRTNSKKQRGCASRFKGVHWNRDRRKWQARIGPRSKRQHLGFFDDERAAARAYNAAAVEHFGEFARLNVLCVERQAVATTGAFPPPWGY